MIDSARRAAASSVTFGIRVRLVESFGLKIFIGDRIVFEFVRDDGTEYIVALRPPQAYQ
ncbi:hypothetical protein NJ7G_2428 [Natrinema sp. J7-2]|nr:hypothetical protein NJ7G_2428 [Natrinema sp. J7-2]